jgi:hypothetical protein
VPKPSRPERDDLRFETDMSMDELPEEMTGNRMLLDDAEADDELYLVDQEAELSRLRKQGNQPRGNPPKH